jgi:hypothetical protein
MTNCCKNESVYVRMINGMKNALRNEEIRYTYRYPRVTKSTFVGTRYPS